MFGHVTLEARSCEDCLSETALRRLSGRKASTGFATLRRWYQEAVPVSDTLFPVSDTLFKVGQLQPRLSPLKTARLSLGRFDSYTLPPRAAAVRPALLGGVPPATLVGTPRHGGVDMNRKGFTLIELPIVVVIIGILAAIAIPKFANTKEKAYLASMKSDLRNLVTAEEAYFADSVKYTSNLGTAYATTSGVVGPTINVTADGWTANVTHTTTTKKCYIYVGSTALAPANKEGEPKCQ